MRAAILAAAGLLVGCEAAPGFSLVAEERIGGVLLSAWSDGDRLLAVGGQLDGSAAVMASEAGGAGSTRRSAVPWTRSSPTCGGIFPDWRRSSASLLFSGSAER